MNWEVWTMPRKTSCCNGTLLRSDVRHYWPAGFLYVLVWLMILPIPLLQTARDYLRFQSEQTVQLAAQLHNHVYAAMTGSLVLAVLAGAVIPMAVYAYLMTPRAVGLMHTLPVTRTSQFFTHFLSGFGLLTAGNLLIFLLSALAMMPSGSVDWAALGLWLLVTELLELFFLSLGTLCAMATGWLLAIPVLYGAANCIVLLVCVVVQSLQRWFYFGFESTTFPMAVIWLTPIARLSTAVCGYADVLVPREGEEVYLRVLPEGGMTSLLVYAIVGLALLALGWLLYRRRPSEAAGDAIAFRWLRPIVRWTVGLCGGLGLGLFLSVALLGGLVGGLVQLLLCQTVMGLLCFFAAQMLLQKSFRVFRRSWKEALALVIALAAITLCIRQDFFDVQNRIPGASQVDTVSVQLYAGDSSYCKTDDPAVLERVQALHRAALAQGEDMAVNSDRHMSIRLRYELKNGDTVRRDYTIACVSGTETYRLTNQLLNMPQFRRSAMGIDWLETSGLDAVRSGYVEDYWTGATVDLTREQATELCRLAQQDANDVSDSDVLAAMAANSDDAYAAAAKEDTLPAETEAWDVYRYNIVIYAMVDGRDVSRSLTPMGYCTRMQSFIGSLDFTNTTTVDTEAVS